MARVLFICGLAGVHVARFLFTLGLVALFKTWSFLIMARVLFTFGLAGLHLARVLFLFRLVALHLARIFVNVGCFGYDIVYVWLGCLTFG